jgi:hypothetical protein
LAADAPAAATLLEVLAFLSPDGVTDDLIRGLFRAGDPDLEIADAVAQLRRFSLVDRDATSLIVHRLVQAVVRSRLDPAARADRFHTAVGLLTAADPGDPADPETWPRWAAMAPHAAVQAHIASELALPPGPQLLELLQRTASYLQHRGSQQTASTVLESAVNLAGHHQQGRCGHGELHSDVDPLDQAGHPTTAPGGRTRALHPLDAARQPAE